MRKFAIAGLLSASVLAPAAMAKSPYSDLPANHWAYAQIKALSDAGIVRGDGAGKFKGDEKISRYEAAIMVHNAVQHVMKIKGMGGSVDPEIMDTLNSLITELTDELQVAEVRIEENSDAIAMLKQHVHNMNRGANVAMGNGNIKFMGQAMFSLLSGGDDTQYSSVNTNVLGTREGVNEFLVDYFDLGIAADIDSKTSFHARASVYTGGNANGAVANNIAFDDYMYVAVKNLWDKWDMVLGRMYLPTGHEVSGAFRTNPFFVTNSLVEQMYGNMVTGAYFTYQSDSKWNWGVAIHNGDVEMPGNKVRRHANHSLHLGTANVAGTGVAVANENQAFVGLQTTNIGTTLNAVRGVTNANSTDEFGYLIKVGRSHKDGDFSWDLAYVTNGAGMETGAAANAVAGQSEMDYFQIGATYRANEDWQFNAEYVDGSVENYVATGAGDLVGRTAFNTGVGAFGTAGAVAAARGTIVEDDFTTWYLQAVYNLNSKSTLGVRYSSHETDRVGTRVAGLNHNGTFDDELSEWALAWTRKVSDNGTIIVEYSTVDVDLINGVNGNTARTLTGRTSDDFDVIRASYRIDF